MHTQSSLHSKFSSRASKSLTMSCKRLFSTSTWDRTLVLGTWQTLGWPSHDGSMSSGRDVPMMAFCHIHFSTLLLQCPSTTLQWDKTLIWDKICGSKDSTCACVSGSFHKSHFSMCSKHTHCSREIAFLHCSLQGHGSYSVNHRLCAISPQRSNVILIHLHTQPPHESN